MATSDADEEFWGHTEDETCEYNVNFTTYTGLNVPCSVHCIFGQGGPTLSMKNKLGMAIAIGANAVIPMALNLQKYAHLRNTGPDGEPIVHFTRIPLWWLGIIGMIAGEFFNLLAYGYAPTAIVAPVGAVGVFFNGVIATVFVKEPFTRYHLMGKLMIGCGVVMVVTSVPEVQLDLTRDTMEEFVIPDPRCWIFFLALGVFVPLWMKFVLPRYRTKHVLVYLVLCAAIASATVVASRSFSSMLTDAFEHGTWLDLFYPVSLASLVIIAVTAVWSTAYLNKAMMHFGNNEVVPVYYTTFTLSSVGGGAIVYSEFRCLNFSHTMLFCCGCLCTFIGVYFVASGRGDSKKFKGGKRLMDGPLSPDGGPAPMPSDRREGGEAAESSPAAAALAREPDLPWAGMSVNPDLGLNGVQLGKHGMDTNSMMMGSLGKNGTFTVAGVILEETNNMIRRNSGDRMGRDAGGSSSPNSRKNTSEMVLAPVPEAPAGASPQPAAGAAPPSRKAPVVPLDLEARFDSSGFDAAAAAAATAQNGAGSSGSAPTRNGGGGGHADDAKAQPNGERHSGANGAPPREEEIQPAADDDLT